MIKIQDIATLSNGINFGKSAYTSGVKLIGVSDFKDRIYPDFDSLQEVSAKVVRKNDFLHKGDIVFVRSNGNKELVGRCMLINKDIPVTYSGFCIRLRLNDTKRYNPVYFTYLFKSMDFRKAMSGTAVGANIQNLSQGRLGSYEFECPPIDVQRRIATILSRYDSLIENYRKQIKLLEEAAQCLYKEWFVDFRFPGHEGTKIVDGVPEGWEKSCIADVTTKVTTGLNPRKNFVLGHGHNYYVTIKNMGENTFSLDEKCDRVDDEALTKINKRSKIKIGDILFSGIGTIGRVALIDIPTSNWNVSESVFTMRANDYISKEFLYLLLLDSKMQNYCQSHSHGAAQKGIRMADLKSFAFPLAPKGILDTFTSKVKPLLDTITKLRHQIRLLTEARDLLLPKLMSGEIEM